DEVGEVARRGEGLTDRRPLAEVPTVERTGPTGHGVRVLVVVGPDHRGTRGDADRGRRERPRGAKERGRAARWGMPPAAAPAGVVGPGIAGGGVVVGGGEVGSFATTVIVPL